MDLFTIIALPVVGLVIVPLIIMATRRGLRRSGARPFARHRDGAHHVGMFAGFYGGDGGGGFGGGCDGGSGGGCGGGGC